ncbi:MAG: electron transport complex subunit RsxC [Gammaproteobacteria bacterium]|jgi:electron transport complex protein RnfC
MPEQTGSKASLPALSMDRLHHFHGGLELPGHRELTASRPVKQGGIPPLLVLPLSQHIGEPAECLVKPGERVRKGQQIARPAGNISAPVHAPSSGTVLAVEARPVPHPSGLDAMCIVIGTDGRDTWLESGATVRTDYRQADPATLCEQVRQAGIVGLGGAGFPTQAKLDTARQGVELLLINGVECEPYISCDDRLLQERAPAVIEGVKILRHIVRPAACVIAVEDNMPAALQSLRTALDSAGETGIGVVSVPSIYPAGGERQLIKVLTGREVPSQGLPADIGIICQNVGTAAAVYNAIVKRRPLLSRIVTVTGEGVTSPQNIDSLIGTPVSWLVERCGGYTADVDRLLIGGPMMGYAVGTDRVPVIKTTNCVLAVSRDEMPPPPPAQPCIRCSKCVDVCPADLLPQQLYWYARSSDHDSAQDYDLFDCIECGCCAYVCPSHIPLVQYYRHAKMEIWEQEQQKKAADIARQRHEARLQRLERIKRERAERMARRKRDLSAGDDGKATKQAAIQAALERVKQKKARSDIKPENVDNLTAEQRRLIAEIDRRRQKQTRGADG